MNNTDYVSDVMSAFLAVEQGLSYSQFEALEFSELLNIDEWSEILELTDRTLSNYKHDNRLFKSLQTEKIIQIHDLFLQGVQLFGTRHSFEDWLNQKNKLFQGYKPKELLKNSFGIALLRSELLAITHGIFA